MGFESLVVGSISILAAFYANQYEEIDRAKAFTEKPTDFLLPRAKEYDFIVVGAGSAGSTVANRLSNEFTVLLLEAGGDPIPQNYVPGLYGFLLEQPPIVDLQKSVKHAHNTGGLAKVGRGKFLGGTSVINGLSYNRGHPQDFDNWANLTGDESWNYKNVLKYFQMSEDFHEEENLNGHLGVGGPLTIRKGGKELPQSYKAFMDGARELGYKEFVNSNGPQTEGFGPVSETIQFGRRVSSYDAFIKPILERKTLTISRYSEVSKVDIDKNNRAIGVYYTRHGIHSYARAKFEVIVSAGTMNSPMILLMSGIGPERQLKAAKIPIRNNLPVGQALQDHPFSIVCAKFNDERNYPLNNFSQKDVSDFVDRGRGPLTLPWGIVGQAFVVSSMTKSESRPDWPDIELILFHNTSMYFPNVDENKICMLVILGRVAGRSSLSLDTTNTMNPGIWDPKWLENDRDVKVIVEGVKLAVALLESHAFKSLDVSLIKNLSPDCEHEQYGTDSYWECYVKKVILTTKIVRTAVGSCKMGGKDDETAVVDTQLRVKGIKGLRVIDNSIHPTITNANINAPAIMIGQKGAHMILREYERGELKNDCSVE